MKRKDFLKLFGIAGTGLALPVLQSEAQTRAGIRVNNRKIVKVSGRVYENNKGIAGVAVTDGITVVVTDRSGRYSFESAAEAEFVYISLPAGYAFPNEKKIARFYERINKEAESSRPISV